MISCILAISFIHVLVLVLVLVLPLSLLYLPLSLTVLPAIEGSLLPAPTPSSPILPLDDRNSVLLASTSGTPRPPPPGPPPPGPRLGHLHRLLHRPCLSQFPPRPPRHLRSSASTTREARDRRVNDRAEATNLYVPPPLEHIEAAWCLPARLRGRNLLGVCSMHPVELNGLASTSVEEEKEEKQGG
eukprot:756153-Hanusia_phi.AAC.6